MSRDSGALGDWAFVLFPVLLAFGMAGFSGYMAIRWGLAYRWPAVPCVIENSSVREKRDRELGPSYVVDVRYRYAWGGADYTGKTHRVDYDGDRDIAYAERVVRAYPKGADRLCYVNPGRPGEAILEHANPLFPAAVVVALLFCLAAQVGAFRRPETTFMDTGAPLAATAGVLSCLLLFAPPLWAGLSTLGWRANPAVVVSSRVLHTARVGMFPVPAYWPDVTFEYRVGGVTYRSSRYNASDLGTPWYYGPGGVARRHPPGSAVTCYVDPSDPSRAVLSRRFSGTQLFGIFPILLAAMMAIEALRPYTSRGLPLGSPRFWGTLALGLVTYLALQALAATGWDLMRDRADGVSEWPEVVGVVAAGLISTALVAAWVSLAFWRGCEWRWRGRPVKGDKSLKDREVDA
jgi:hypothetical protein